MTPPNLPVVMGNYVVFGEGVTVINDNDEWLYAIGENHTWRTKRADLKEWEYVCETSKLSKD